MPQVFAQSTAQTVRFRPSAEAPGGHSFPTMRAGQPLRWVNTRPMDISTKALCSSTAEWQAAYAQRGLPTFPINPMADDGKTKRPCVKHYDKIGLRASQQLALKFRDANGLACMAGRATGSPSSILTREVPKAERLMAEAQCAYGQSRFIVRTGRNGLHADHRHNGEPRKIRPNPTCPI